MTREEQNIRITAKMYEMRETARNLFGAGYAGKVEPWKLAVSRMQDRLQCDGPIQAALTMANPNAGHSVER